MRSGVWQKPWTLPTRCQSHPPRHNKKVCCQMFPGRGESPLVEKCCFIILLAFCHFSSPKHSMLSLDSVLKSRDVTLPTKVCLVKTMVFPVIMYSQKVEAFKLSCWRRLLGVLWIARRSNQSILMEINPGYSLEGLMLKLKLQYFGYGHDGQSRLIGKEPDAGKD